MLLALLSLHGNALAELRSDAGLKYVEGFVREMGEVVDPDCPEEVANDIRRCARLLDAHVRQDIPELNATLGEASAQRRTLELTVALLDVFEHLLPELTSTAGIKWLEACIAGFGTEENQQ